MGQLEPTVPQYEYIYAQEPFPALVAGFGAGKTEAAVSRSIIGKLAYPTLNRGFYEPTYDLIRQIAFPRFEEMLENLSIPYRLYKSPLNYVEIEDHGKIIFRSMDQPQRIIGYEHADADIDELDTLKEADAAEVWRRVLSRNRQKKPDKKPNTLGVTTTPEGFRFVYKTWGTNLREGYRLIKAPTESNPHLPEGYIDSLKDIYPDNLLQAYLNGDFVNLTSGTVYTSFIREACNSCEAVKEKEPIFIGMDFNVTNMSGIVLVRRGANYHAVEELTGIYDTPAMIDTIREKYPEHSIRVYPDSSGGNRKTVNASTNDLALLNQAGFLVDAPSKNPRVKDRVVAVNTALEKRSLFVNVSACPELTKGLEQQAYDKNGEPDKSSGLDHANDALGYFVNQMLPVVKPVAAFNVRFAV